MVARPTQARATAMHLALAFLMAGSALAAVSISTPQATAQGGSLQLKAGAYLDALQYSQSYPNFPCSGGQAVVMARPDGTTVQYKQVKIAPSNARQVDFAFDLVADPGTANAPGVSKAITWDASLSTANGWDVRANNGGTAATGTVTFTRAPLPPPPADAPPSEEPPVSIPQGTHLLAGNIGFTTDYDVVMSSTANTVDVPVTADATGPSGNVAAGAINQLQAPMAHVASVSNGAALVGGARAGPGATEFLTFTNGTLALGATFTIAFIVPSDAVGDAAGATPYNYPIRVIPDQSAQSASKMCIRIDNTPPRVTSVVTRDSDYDGRIDILEVNFNEPLDPDTHAFIPIEFNASAILPGFGFNQYFTLPTSPPLAYDSSMTPTTQCQDNTIGLIGAPNDVCPMRAILKLAPGPRFDTGITPHLKYPADRMNATVTDLAGNKLAPLEITNTTDGAKPVLISAVATAGSPRMIVTFSENVQGSGTPTASGLRPVRMDYNQPPSGTSCSTNCMSDLVYSDSAAPAAIPPALDGTGDCIASFNTQLPQAADDPNGRQVPNAFRGGPTVHDPNAANANQVTVALDPSVQPKDYSATNTRPECTWGQFGAADTSQTAGDTLMLATASNPPSSCSFVHDFPPCDKTIFDQKGLHAVTYKAKPPRKGGDGNDPRIVSGPFVKQASINIDSFKMTVLFNGPVASAEGDTVGIQLSDLDIVKADDSGQGPSGIVKIDHQPGSDQAILTLDHPARPTDVDDTPMHLRVVCTPGHGVKAFGVPGLLVPCYDPDADSYPDVNAVDLTPPAFTPPPNFPYDLSTIDANHDGYIDGIKAYFSERIDDSSFCGGPLGQPPAICNSDGQIDSQCSNPAEGILIVTGMPGPYTWDTDLLPDDNEGIIRFPETPGHLERTDFTPAILTNACMSSTGNYGKPAEDSDGNVIEAAGIFNTRGTGLFADQSHPQPASPPYLKANLMKRICDPFTDNSIPCDPDTTITVTVKDGAPPVIWSAKTIDTPPVGGLEGNGYLDGYVLKFSEPVSDCTIRNNLGEWHVAGYDVSGIRTNVPLSLAYVTPCNVDPTTHLPFGENDDTIVLDFNESAAPDTDAKPDLTYAPTPGCGSCGARDLVGNVMPAIGSLAVNEEDDAPPVIVSSNDALHPGVCGVSGFAGSDQVTIQFSEPVDNGDKGGLTRSAFTYTNGGGNGGASGLSSTAQVLHHAGDKVAILTLNAPLTNADVFGVRNGTRIVQPADLLAAQQFSIFEVSPTVAVKKSVSLATHSFCKGLDVTPPGPVTDLMVVQGLASANAVTLSWNAPPQDNGNPFSGNVSNYAVYVYTQVAVDAQGTLQTSESGPGFVGKLVTDHSVDPGSCPAATNGTRAPPCTLACRNTATVMSTAVSLGQLLLRVDPSPCALALPGQVQHATVVGLNPNTTYSFLVAGIDNATDLLGHPAPNVGYIDHYVSATTGIDRTPPSPAPVVYSPAPYQVANSTTPTFRWTNSSDAESAITYYLAINQKMDYTPTPSDIAVLGLSCGSACTYTPTTALAPGTWIFHVAARSAGGLVAAPPRVFYIGAAPVDPKSIANANAGVLTVATRLYDRYDVNWTLPSLDDVQAAVHGGSFQGIRILRLVCDSDGTCDRQLAASINGTYDSLKTGDWTDPEVVGNFTSTPSYRVEMVFAKDQVQDASQAGFSAPTDVTPHPSPWPWIIGMLVLLVVIGAVVLWAVRSSKARAAARAKAAEAPAGVDPQTGLPTHDVKCPSCGTPFQAVGTLPLQITCPNCGVSGVLQ